MRCHFSDTDNDGETNPPAYNIWTSGTLQTPNILKSILNPNGQENCYSEELSNLCSLDPVSSSHKRKIDCEKEDIEERFHKVQRKKQLQKVAARASLVVDDLEDSDEEDRMYQQMNWIEKENAMNFRSFDDSDSDDDLANNQQPYSSVVRLPRLKWKDERRRLLRISMAKIQGVEDPEAYLRRSVLINNTVKRLQKDVAMNYRYCPSASTSFFQGNISFQNDGISNWDATDIYKQQIPSESIEYDIDLKKYPPAPYCDVPCSLKFHLACAALTSSQSLDVPQRDPTDPNDPTYCSSPYEEEQRPNIPLPSLVIKPPSSLHLFSSQPCGLQYRNHSEDSRDEYRESPGSSPILDSVVYHSLVTSLET